jgi:hypothetical protein
VVDAAVLPDHSDWSVEVGSRVGFDSANDDSCCSDWAKGDVAQ